MSNAKNLKVTENHIFIILENNLLKYIEAKHIKEGNKMLD